MRRDDGEEMVKIPVQVLSNGTIAMESGARLPSILTGSLADLVLPAASLQNARVVAALNESASTPLLAKGEIVWLRLHPSETPGETLRRFDDDAPHPEMAGHLFAPVSLDEVLQLVTRGTKRGQLEKARCRVHLGARAAPVEAISLNHAYRLLSEMFERHRVSFGGNVFAAAFIRRDQGWVSLEALRASAEGIARKAVDRSIAAIEGGQAELSFHDDRN